MIHNARSAFCVNLDVFKFHEGAGAFDRHKAAVESIYGFFVAAVFFERFKPGMDDLKLLAHGGAKSVDIFVFCANGNDGGHDHLNGGMLLGRGVFSRSVLGFRFVLVCAVLAGLGFKQLLGQRDGPAGLCLLQLRDHRINDEGAGRPGFDVDSLDQGFKHVHHEQQKVNKLVGGCNFALANIIEQSFCLVGEGVELNVADNAAVALHVVEKTEDIVDQLVAANGVFFQIQQAIGKIFDGVVGLVDKIFQMPLAKGGEGIRRNFGQGEHPVLARHGRAAVTLFIVVGSIVALGSRISSRGLFLGLFVCFGVCGLGGRGIKRGFCHSFLCRVWLHGNRRRSFARHDGVDLGHDMFNFHIAFGVVGFKIVDHLAQGISGGQDDIHDFRGHNHSALAQFVQNIF